VVVVVAVVVEGAESYRWQELSCFGTR
jgi:hypothetical protein